LQNGLILIIRNSIKFKYCTRVCLSIVENNIEHSGADLRRKWEIYHPNNSVAPPPDIIYCVALHSLVFKEYFERNQQNAVFCILLVSLKMHFIIEY